MDSLLEFKSVHKRFARAAQPALDGVGFSVGQGEIFGLLGHNGAGKSTALGVMLGLVEPDDGEVTIGGVSVQEDRASALRKVGAIFEGPAFYEYLSGWANLRMLCAYSGWWDGAVAREAVALVGLEKRIQDRVGAYSHGMRQRLALAQALLPSPQLLLLDEPTDGLDPGGIKEFRELVLRLRDERGITVLLNSHLLTEVEQMCDRFAILRHGKLVHEGAVRAGSDRQWRLVTEGPRSLDPVLDELGVGRPLPETVVLPDDLTSAALVRALVAAGIGVREISPLRRTLEDLYLEVSSGAGDVREDLR